MNNVVLDKIPQKKIRSFVQVLLDDKVNSAKDIKSTHNCWESVGELLKHEEKFKVSKDIEEVWGHYLQSDPNKIWNGNLVSFGLMVSKNDNEVTYVDEPFNGAQKGQVYFINLKILKGLYQLAVSHEILNINNEEKYIEISYVEGGKSIGIQRIALRSKNANETEIIHTTFYKSKSKFRDKFIYPYFHSKVLQEYHSNMINHIDKSSRG